MKNLIPFLARTHGVHSFNNIMQSIHEPSESYKRRGLSTYWWVQRLFGVRSIQKMLVLHQSNASVNGPDAFLMRIGENQNRDVMNRIAAEEFHATTRFAAVHRDADDAFSTGTINSSLNANFRRRRNSIHDQTDEHYFVGWVTERDVQNPFRGALGEFLIHLSAHYDVRIKMMLPTTKIVAVFC